MNTSSDFRTLISHYSSVAVAMTSVSMTLPLQSQDEDSMAEKRPKPRQPKSREKWSQLWFIPPSVLNDREVSFEGKKGKRHGFDRYNHLSCKDCRKTFHSSEALSIHRADSHHGSSSATPRYTPSPSFSSRFSRVSLSGSLRRSSRRRSHNNYCDDDIEILDGPSDSHSTHPRSAKKKTSIIEEVCIDDDEEVSIEEVCANDDSIQEVTIEEVSANDDSSIEELSIEPDITPILDTSSVQITPLRNQEDEVLLMDDTPEEEDVIEVLESHKRKHEEMEDDMVEIQSSSGKRMFVNKSRLRSLGI